MGLVTIVMTCATCCAGSGDSAGAGGKESASATKWRSLGTALSDLAMLAIRIEHRHFWQCCSCNARFYG
ncbi:hypothetical protein STW0522KLE44_47470 [Klebsiella sp. STW0522-44]|nr:hypothetical protein STW0522KLE44_47470 [Klebsiella sp. STW0522-44]